MIYKIVFCFGFWTIFWKLSTSNFQDISEVIQSVDVSNVKLHVTSKRKCHNGIAVGFRNRMWLESRGRDEVTIYNLKNDLKRGVMGWLAEFLVCGASQIQINLTRPTIRHPRPLQQDQR